MKTLFLLRHAKAVRDPGVADIDRPLAPRGRHDAQAMGRYLKAKRAGLERILCSPARRTTETLETVLAELAVEPLVEILEGLYLGGRPALLAAIRELPAGIDRAMMVAHNPDLHDLALALAGAGAELRALADKFPTGTLAVLSFPGSVWSEVAPGAGTLLALVRPGDLS